MTEQEKQEQTIKEYCDKHRISVEALKTAGALKIIKEQEGSYGKR